MMSLAAERADQQMLMDVQAVSNYFVGSPTTSACSRGTSIAGPSETILQEGEEGTWLGSCCRASWTWSSTARRCTRSSAADRQRDDRLVWRRAAGDPQVQLPGYIADPMGELQQLSMKHPQVGLQFMRVMGMQSINTTRFQGGGKMKMRR